MELIFRLIPPGLLVWIPALIVLGILLKHGTNFPTDLIAIVLFAISAAVSALYGLVATEGMSTPLRITEVLVAYGLGYGFLLAVSAVFIYDTVHGVMKQIRERKAKKTEAEHMTVSVKEKTEMADAAVKEKAKKFHMTSGLTYLLVVIGSVALGTLMALPWGIGSALDFVSKAIFLALIMVMAADSAFKIRYEKWKLMWQYWIGLILILVADWCFLWASKTTEWLWMGLALGLAALFGISGAGVLFIPYKKKVEEKKAADLEEYRKALVAKGVDADTAKEIADAAKED